MVFSLKNETPVVAIDAVAGGAKVTAQARALGWPLLLDGDTVSPQELAHAVGLCLNGSMDQRVQTCRATAIARVRDLERTFGNRLRQLER